MVDTRFTHPKLKMGLSQLSAITDQETVPTAEVMCHLLKLSMDVTNVTLNRNLFEVLREEKIGTYKLECEAMNLFVDGTSSKGKERSGKKEKKIEVIRNHRDGDKVKDLIDLKVKYMLKEEKSKRKEYAR